MEVKRLCHSKVAASNSRVTESSLNKFPANMNIIWQEFKMYNILGRKVFPLTVAKIALVHFFECTLQFRRLSERSKVAL